MKEYSYVVNDDNSFTIFHYGEEIHRSRQFRLRVQAERKAGDWIHTAKDDLDVIGDVTLDVQSVSIDPETLFSRRPKNG